jgi:choline dehydrogenase
LTSFDVIVVGGGAAGCVLAARLSEDPGRTVCLVEAGPDYGPRSAGRWPADLLDPSGLPDSHDWRDGEDELSWARVIGGCSAHNACAVTRGAAAEYDSWQHAGGPGWRWETLEPCLLRAREALGVRVREPPDVSSWHAAVVDAMVEAGLPHLSDLDAEQVGVGVAPTNVVGGARQNAAFAYLDAARDRPNLTVVGDTLVDRVLLGQGGRVTGVAVRGPDGEHERGAGAVVLAAGAYGSPAVLLRSGVGPEGELRVHGIEVLHELAGVGEGLADHCRAGIGFALRDEAGAALRAEHGEQAIVAQCMAKWASSRADGAWDMHMLGIVVPARDSGRITAGLVAPRSRGRVGLSSTDPSRLPRVEPRFLSDEEGHDLAALAEGVEFMRSLGATRALSALVTGESDPGPEVDAAAHARATVTTYYHPTGTCRLGPPDDSHAVLDSRAAVHGLEGLYVGDASTVPEPVRAGTHLTALAVAERVAELLRAGP